MVRKINKYGYNNKTKNEALVVQGNDIFAYHLQDPEINALYEDICQKLYDMFIDSENAIANLSFELDEVDKNAYDGEIYNEVKHELVSQINRVKSNIDNTIRNVEDLVDYANTHKLEKYRKQVEKWYA